MNTVNPIPEGYHTITVALTVSEAAKAIEFYRKAFGAEEIARMTAPDGERVMHAELRIGDTILMLSDEFPGMGRRSPKALGGTPVMLMIYTRDTDAAFQRAIEAGAKERMRPEDMFWGDRFCEVEDPFGNLWSMATHVEDVTPEEIKARAEKLWPR